MAYTFLGTYKTKGKNIYGTTLNHYEFGIDVYIEQSNAVNNYTNVKTVAWVMMLKGGSTTTSSTYYFKENNVTYQNLYIKLGVNDSSGYATPYHSNEKISTYYHNEDGTKSITLNFSVETEVTQSANANLNNYCFKSASITETITLPTINRLSPFSFTGSFTMGSGNAITISPYVSSFRHNIEVHFGSYKEVVASNIETSYTWTPSKDLGHQIPNATSGVGTIFVHTYNGGTYIGTESKTFTLWVSGDMQPSFTYIYVQNEDFNNLLLTTMSSVSFEIQNATGSCGSTITSYSISGEGLSVNSSYSTTSVYSSSGTFTYTLKVTDSRGRTASMTKSVNVYAYAKPVLTVTANRCMLDGKLDDIGNYASIEVAYTVANPNNANQNAKEITIEYKRSDQEYFDRFYTGTLANYSGTQTYTNTSITFDSAWSYDFKVTITDTFNNTEVTSSISTSTCILDIEPQGLGVGKYHQNGALDIMGDIYFNGFALTCDDNGDLSFDGNSVAVTKSVNFTPYLFSNSQPSATWTQTNAVGSATYFGDLVYAQGRVIAVHTGTADGTAEVAIGGLPELGTWIHPPVNFCFVGGLTTNLNSQTYAIRGFIEPNTAYIRLCFDYRQEASWQYLRSTHIQNGAIDIAFSVLYKWR